MESYRSTIDPCAGNGGGFQTQEMRQQGSVSCSSPSPATMQSFSGQMQEVVRAGPIQVPPARVHSPSVHHAEGARRWFVVRPTAESLHAGPVHTGQTSFCTQVGGGYGMPSPHMFLGGGGYGIAPHMYPTQHTMERGGVMRDEWQWSPHCRPPSQPMHGRLSAPSPMSVRRSAAEPSPLMAMCKERIWMRGGLSTVQLHRLPACKVVPLVARKMSWLATMKLKVMAVTLMGKTLTTSAEDCRKKWQGMLAAAKLILDKCENASGKPSYWDMTVDEWKAEQVPLGFEKALWEAMEWKLNRPSIKCDKTLASENLPGNAGGNSTCGSSAQPSSGRSASDGKATEDSDQAAKTRRTNTGETRMDDTISGGTALGRAMEDATRSYGEGLDKAAATLAKATSEAGSAIAAKICDVADAMRGGNTALEMLVGVLARRGGGGNSAAYERADTDPSTR
ncbi:hypothetical protein CBR_g2868 [Chara braunii]|uniref:Myb-like domain-containing protein n=1 Tax=Chara braunii TaxID=69332 RepID=A0A388KE39_CHABU|nr:hypothetical protein CBR_g2868 [Chara braunii]|eukprot:GBG68324.1 hypothetical protein CBR_g2868 [Chara braunii]